MNMATNRNIERILLIWTIIGAVLLAEYVVALQEYNCSEVKCLSKIDCPSDSYIRELQEFNEISIINDNDNDNNIEEEIYLNCCIKKKCACKLCHRPSCHNSSLVLMEIIKESEIPGKCCGQYECIYEPNCTDIQNTKGYGWLIDCQRCECLAGEKICHRSCDEIRLPPANCIGQNSKIFSNGEQWKEDECTQCECQNGEKKCQTSFCKQLNCQHKIKLPGECCPICITTTTTTTTIKTTEPRKELSSSTSSSASPIPSSAPSPAPSPPSTTTTTTTTQSIPPCGSGGSTTTKDSSSSSSSSSETYSVRTEYVEVIQTSKENCILYGIIAALSIILVVFITLYYYERSKQRSYRPVASLDDNYNKIKLKGGDF